ncbi:hypothetical protein L596_011112 [Steinernema carpocapsae]|uniref:Uncharacterized protein n=1 Tax=Steinernema carpocapsae TaxID=34508 RepID=A0A4V6A4F8_STECR|nr:hypothetical protein L596_011112 [Steinernema carpocapsae]
MLLQQFGSHFSVSSSFSFAEVHYLPRGKRRTFGVLAKSAIPSEDVEKRAKTEAVVLAGWNNSSVSLRSSVCGDSEQTRVASRCDIGRRRGPVVVLFGAHRSGRIADFFEASAIPTTCDVGVAERRKEASWHEGLAQTLRAPGPENHSLLEASPLSRVEPVFGSYSPIHTNMQFETFICHYSNPAEPPYMMFSWTGRANVVKSTWRVIQCSSDSRRDS